MFPIDNPSSVPLPPARAPAGNPGYFTSDGESGTIVPPDWLNIVQNELIAVIQNAGIVLNKDDDTQLLQSIQSLVEIDLSGYVLSDDLNALLGNYVQRAGDTMSGLLTLGTQPITNPLHATTKRYVDAEIIKVMEAVLGIPDLPDLSNFITAGGLEAALANYTPEAPSDGNYYARRNHAWASFTPGGGGGGIAEPTTVGNFVRNWNGTVGSWQAAGSGTGTVTQIIAGTGLTGGTITGSGTIALATPVSLANGGTNATTAAAARTQLAITMDNVTGITSGTGYLQRTGTNTWSLGAGGGTTGNYLPLTGGTLTGDLAVNSDWISGRNVSLSGAAYLHGLDMGGAGIGNCGGMDVNKGTLAGGWLYSRGDGNFDGNVGVAGTVYGGNLSANGVVYFGGMYWQNNGGWAYCPWPIQSGQGIYANGWMDCANLNLHGGGIYNCTGMDVGGGSVASSWLYSRGNANVDGTLSCGALNVSYLYANPGVCYPQMNGGWFWAFNMSGNRDFMCYINNGYQGGWWFGACDERLKRDIHPSPVDALGLVNELKFYEFDELDTVNRRRERVIGQRHCSLVAQQLQEHIPEAVIVGPAPEQLLSLNGTMLAVYGLRAVQQLTALVVDLRDRIETLEKAVIP
jgi:hypothetical protein